MHYIVFQASYYLAIGMKMIVKSPNKMVTFKVDLFLSKGNFIQANERCMSYIHVCLADLNLIFNYSVV